MSDEGFELEDVQRLAATLDTVELGEKDRALLHAIFALAGQATGAAGGPDDEVSGFAALPGGLFGSFVTPRRPVPSTWTRSSGECHSRRPVRRAVANRRGRIPTLLSSSDPDHVTPAASARRYPHPRTR